MDGRRSGLRGRNWEFVWGQTVGETSLRSSVGLRGEVSGRRLAGITDNAGRKVKKLNPRSSHHKENIFSLFFFFSFLWYRRKWMVAEPTEVIILLYMNQTIILYA